MLRPSHHLKYSVALIFLLPELKGDKFVRTVVTVKAGEEMSILRRADHNVTRQRVVLLTL